MLFFAYFICGKITNLNDNACLDTSRAARILFVHVTILKPQDDFVNTLIQCKLIKIHRDIVYICNLYNKNRLHKYVQDIISFVNIVVLNK